MDKIKHAAKVITRGGLVVFPTDTLYGLGAMTTDKKTVKKVYAIKRRSREKLLPVIVGGRDQAEKYFIFTSVERALAKKFWPGPLSLVLKTRSKKIATAMGSSILAVRYPANSIAAALARHSGVPITATSANISGQLGYFTIAAIKKQFALAEESRQPDAYLNGGALKRSLPSTIVRVRGKKIIVIREGKVSLSKIQKAAARKMMVIL